MDEARRVERRFHANGQLASSITFVDGLPDGPVEKWNEHGVLIYSAICRKGVMHGVVRTWNSAGVLLGECEFRDGTGVLLRWSESGELLSQNSYRNSALHGPLRVWDSDGGIVVEQLYIDGVKTSKKKYLAAAAADPMLASYLNDYGPLSTTPKQQVVPKPSEAFSSESNELVTRLLADAKEARRWLCEAPDSRSIGEGMSDSAAMSLVERIYSFGAKTVFAADISEYEDQANTGTLIVELPTEPAARQRVFAFEAEVAMDSGFDGAIDVGQRYLLLRFD